LLFDNSIQDEAPASRWRLSAARVARRRTIANFNPRRDRRHQEKTCAIDLTLRTAKNQPFRSYFGRREKDSSNRQ